MHNGKIAAITRVGKPRQKETGFPILWWKRLLVTNSLSLGLRKKRSILSSQATASKEGLQPRLKKRE